MIEVLLGFMTYGESLTVQGDSSKQCKICSKMTSDGQYSIILDQNYKGANHEFGMSSLRIS